jgi:hypothetical protein
MTTDHRDGTVSGPPLQASRIGVPAMLTGMVLAACVACGLPYGEFLVKGTRFGVSSSAPGAFFLLFLLLLLLLPLTRLLRRRWLYTREELLLIAVMMMLASALATRGFTGVFMGIIAAPYYYATVGNAWATKLHPYLPEWMVPQDRQAITWFFEGLPAGQSIPWRAWVQPLGWWLLFMAALCAVIFCLMVILRRQWSEHERLPYPLMQLPLGMVGGGAPGATGRVRPFLAQRVMWLGFSLPFLIHTYNTIATYRTGMAGINLISATLPVFRNTVTLNIKINYLVLGLSYLINTGVAFSMWFFFLLAQFQTSVYARLGIHSTVQLDSCSWRGSIASIMSHQTMGAMMVLVLVGLWAGRAHLREVLRQAWHGCGDAAERELLSYRAAVLGLALGLTFMVGWLLMSGLPLWAVFIFLFGALTVYLALTRVIVEAGLVTAIQGLTGAGLVLSTVGSSALGASGLLGLGFTMPWAGDHMSFLMAPVANGVRLLQGIRERRRITWMLIAAMAIGLVGSTGTTLVLAYDYGAVNLQNQYFSWFAQEPFSVAARLLDNPSTTSWDGWSWLAQGAVAMGVLTFLRQRLLWWPLHPLGFAVGGTWMMGHVWFSIFLAWMVKVLVLRYGGVGAYRSTRGFFLGMFLGYITAAGVWLLVDAFTGLKGATVPMY